MRQPDEFVGPLGHLDGAELVPLATLPSQTHRWGKDEPLVLICRSSGRSDAEARQLEAAGYTKVASMVGGMLAYREVAPRTGTCG